MARPAARTKGHQTEAGAGVPSSRQWPLPALKFASRWAARHGLDGVAWSTPALHLRRWRGLDPPTEAYQRGLPEAAGKVSRVLSLELSRANLLRCRVRPEAGSGPAWQLTNESGQPTCSGFALREQAQRFADLTMTVYRLQAPALWLGGVRRFDRMPLFGVADAEAWSDCSAVDSGPRDRAT